MGFLSDFFGYIPAEQPPQLVSIFPPAAAQRIRSGVLPTIQAGRIILGMNEVCHFVDVGTAVTAKTRRHTVHTGGSYHIAKGFTAHHGQSESVPITEPHYTKGVFYITNQRIIFTASANGFDQKLSKLTAVTPYSDAIQLQFGSKTHTILLPDGTMAKMVLDLLI